MTDKANTEIYGDSQSKNILYELNEGNKVSAKLKAHNVNKIMEELERQGKGKEKAKSSRSHLYSQGIKHLEERSIYLEIDRTGIHCGHQIYMSKKPMPIKGIEYPGKFMPKIPIFSNDEFSRLEVAIRELQGDMLEFWLPLVEPKKDSELSRYVDRLIMMDKVESTYSTKTELHLGNAHDPGEEGVFGKLATNPKSWVPSKSWFSKKIRDNVRFEDVFTIFPPAEQQTIKLWLGRTVLGRTDNVPENSDQPIRHTSRMGLVWLGKTAGLIS